MDNRKPLDFQLFYTIENYELDKKKNQANIIRLVKDGADLAATQNDKTAMELLTIKKLWPCITEITKIKKQIEDDSYKYGLVLLEAVNQGQYEAVKALCEAGTKQTWYYNKSKEHNYCMHVVVKNGYVDILRLLIKHGGDVTATNGAKEGLGQTALELACSLKHWESAEILLENQKISFTHESFVAFQKAFKAKKFDIADGIIRAVGGPNIINAKNDGNTILHNIVKQWTRLGNNSDLLLHFVLSHGIKQKKLNHDNKTAIELASELALSPKTNTNERWRCVKLLIHAHEKLKSNDIIDMHLEKVLQNAIKGQNFIIVQLLLQKGVPCNASSMEMGNIALHLAVKAQNPKILELLLMHGADPSILNKDGINTMDFAKKIKAEAFFQELNSHLDSETLEDLPSVTTVGIFQPARPATDSQLIKASFLSNAQAKRY